MNLLQKCFVPYSVPITVDWTRDRMIDVQPLLNPPPSILQSCQCLMVHSNKPTFNLHITGYSSHYWPGWLLLSNGVSANLKVKFETESISTGWMTWGVNYILNLNHSSHFNTKKRQKADLSSEYDSRGILAAWFYFSQHTLFVVYLYIMTV